MSIFDNELQSSLQGLGCEFSVREDITPEHLFGVVQIWWPSVKKVTDIYSLPNSSIYSDVNNVRTIGLVLDQIAGFRGGNNRSKVLFFGDDLTDFSYEISLTKQTILSICEIPQNSLILIEDIRCLLFLPFTGEAIVVPSKDVP